MKNIFLDTNIVIDFLADRKPFSAAADRLFSLAQENKVKLYVSAVSFSNIYYILKQSFSHVKVLELLDELYDLVEIAEVSQGIIRKSLKTSFFKDFEDCIQYNCALTVRNLSCIVSRDGKEYKKSALPVMSPEEAVALF